MFSNASDSLEKVSLQLNWKYEFSFAGFILAKEKGFYQDAGLDVELIEYSAGIDTVEKVLSNKSNFGIYDSNVVVNNGKLLPTILMATYFQRSPLVFAVSKDIKHPKDLVGKTIMATKDEQQYSSLALMLNHFFVNRKNARFKEHTFNIDDFIQHKVDAISVYRTNQVFELDQQNIEYNILDPADYGFSVNAINLFTSQSEAINHPDRTKRFIAASNKGWAYALAHSEEAISIIHKHYSKNRSLEALRFEAELIPTMMLPDFFEIGETNIELSNRIVKQLQYSGLLASTEKLGDFMFEDVLQKIEKSTGFTDEQHLYLQHKKEITMCVNPDWMPFERIKNGQHTGIAADVIAQFSEKLPIPIRLIETVNWQESLSKAKSRECDILSLASETPRRKKYMDFTSPFLKHPIVLATKNDTFFINDIVEVKDKKLGVVKGYWMAETLRKKIPGINIIDVASISDGLEKVEKGELFGYIDNLVVIADSIQKDFTGVLKVSSRLEENVQLGIATRNDQPQLNEVFEALVKNIDDAELQSIYNKWIAVEHELSFDYSLVWKLLAVITALTSGYLVHSIKLQRLNSKLLTLSVTDKLTGIYNRVKADDVLIEKKADVDRYGTEVSIILLDIDFFKNVNDMHGHIVGDEVLAEFAKILKDNVRVTDFVGRWGGEEFLVICPNTGIDKAVELAEKLLDKIRAHRFPKIGKLTASAGVSQFSKDSNIQRTINNADEALYQSKESGRDKATVYG
jgi:diguanylate cyclase (GGDEF)-like protein